MSIDIFPVVLMQPNKDLVMELEDCLLLKTAKAESVQSVAMIVEGLGFHDVVITGMTERTFLAYFDSIKNMDEEELDFLIKIGFSEVREIKYEDLLPPRKAWIEIRGHFRALVSKWGETVQFGTILDVDDFYQTPKVLISTQFFDDIKKSLGINLMGKYWSIPLIEAHGGNEGVMDHS